MDSGALFAMIFGSEKFEPLVGELQLATQMNAESEAANDPRFRAWKQKKREVQCAVNLAAKLQQFIDDGCDEAKFRAQLKEEADELAASPFGGTLLGAIGMYYLANARAELGSVDGMKANIEQMVHGVLTKGRIAAAGVGAAMTAWNLHSAQKKAEAHEAHAVSGNSKEESAAAKADEDAVNELTLKMQKDMSALGEYMYELSLQFMDV